MENVSHANHANFTRNIQDQNYYIHTGVIRERLNKRCKMDAASYNGNTYSAEASKKSHLAMLNKGPNSSSNEDLSEYTDADESISAPTEILAEFLSAVMLKDYGPALKYCKLILQYEPNNVTAKEFYPLIVDKLQQSLLDDKSEDNEDDDADDDDDDSSDTTSSSSDSSTSSSDSSSDEADDDENDNDNKKQTNFIDKNNENTSQGSKGSSGTTGSYSSLEDDEADIEQLALLAASKLHVDNVERNGNDICETYCNSTAHSCPKDTLNNSNNLAFVFNSDSESPTDPISQHTITMLRSRVVPN